MGIKTRRKKGVPKRGRPKKTRKRKWKYKYTTTDIQYDLEWLKFKRTKAYIAKTPKQLENRLLEYINSSKNLNQMLRRIFRAISYINRKGRFAKQRIKMEAIKANFYAGANRIIEFEWLNNQYKLNKFLIQGWKTYWQDAWKWIFYIACDRPYRLKMMSFFKRFTYVKKEHPRNKHAHRFWRFLKWCYKHYRHRVYRYKKSFEWKEILDF